MYLIQASSSLCTYANWWSSFDWAGRSSCPAKHYITGLERSSTSDYEEDYIYHIEGAQCCKGTPGYENRDSQCLSANWVHSFDRSVSNSELDVICTIYRAKLRAKLLNGETSD